MWYRYIPKINNDSSFESVSFLFCTNKRIPFGGDREPTQLGERAAGDTYFLRFVAQKGVYFYTYFWIGLNILNTDADYTWFDGRKVIALLLQLIVY